MNAWTSRLALLAAVVMVAAAAEKGDEDLTGPYAVVAGWMKPVEPGVTTYVVGVFAETPDRVFVTSTGATPGRQVGTFDPKAPGAKLDHLLMVLNRQGQVVEEWRQWYPMFSNPHVVRIDPYDPERHVWFIDRGAQQLFEFTNDGKTLVKTLGERGVAAADDRHFGRPADIAWLPDGTMFVADGYQNRRVVKLDRTGKFLMAWGRQGSGPGEFGGTVHSIALDAKQRVYVTDIGNHRLQIFDKNGRFLDAWPIPGAIHVMVTKDQSVWVLDTTTNRLLKYNTDGKLLTYWGAGGDFPGGFAGAHDMSVDPEGALYIDMGFNHRIEKFTPKPGADRTRLVGQPMN